MMTFSDGQYISGLGMDELPGAEAAILCHKTKPTRITELGPEIIKLHVCSCLPPVFLLSEKTPAPPPHLPWLSQCEPSFLFFAAKWPFSRRIA